MVTSKSAAVDTSASFSAAHSVPDCLEPNGPRRKKRYSKAILLPRRDTEPQTLHSQVASSRTASSSQHSCRRTCDQPAATPVPAERVLEPVLHGGHKAWSNLDTQLTFRQPVDKSPTNSDPRAYFQIVSIRLEPGTKTVRVPQD